MFWKSWITSRYYSVSNIDTETLMLMMKLSERDTGIYDFNRILL